jgi:truncated hemoglobin YjbI
MTRKRSTYRPRGINPTAHLMAMHGAARLTRDDRTVWALQMYDALDAVAKGKAQRQQWGTIFDAVNLAEELVRSTTYSGIAAAMADQWGNA